MTLVLIHSFIISIWQIQFHALKQTLHILNSMLEHVQREEEKNELGGLCVTRNENSG